MLFTYIAEFVRIDFYESVSEKGNLEDRWSMYYECTLKVFIKIFLTGMSPNLYMHHFMGNILQYCKNIKHVAGI
jgi:hypothetical protein